MNLPSYLVVARTLQQARSLLTTFGGTFNREEANFGDNPAVDFINLEVRGDSRIELINRLEDEVVAIVSLLSGMYRHSHQMVVAARSDFFRVKMSVGSVNRLRRFASQAVAMPVTEVP